MPAKRPTITVTPIDPDEFVFEVVYQDPTNQRIAVEVVDLNEHGTWPSPAKQSDMLADAVRKVFDRAWTYYSGEEVER